MHLSTILPVSCPKGRSWAASLTKSATNEKRKTNFAASWMLSDWAKSWYYSSFFYCAHAHQRAHFPCSALWCKEIELVSDLMTLSQLQQRYGRTPKKHSSRRHDLGGSPQKRATCLKVFITTPRKPNSAQRKTARVVFSNSRKVTAYIPGMSHNLQKFSAVLVRGGRVKDLPGVRYTTIRGKYDLHRLVLRRNRRSLYGTTLPDGDTRRVAYRKRTL